MIVLYTDGGCSGNGTAEAVMCAAVADEDGKIVAHRKGVKGGSNNIAELMAVYEALNYCEGQGINEVEIKTDSTVMVAWTAGRIGSCLDMDKAELLYKNIVRLGKTVKFKVTWIRRNGNKAGWFLEEQLGK